ncbi:MAG: hypothetical protein JXR86_07930 [Spirochaetales bacterium]|nr:hypothetical protein [Spirochaetales bacterium]
MENNPDRLEKVEELLKRKKRNGNQICWIKYNPDAELSYDIVDAEEDIKWMIYEIRRLQNENRELKEFAETLRDQISEELNRGLK